MNPHLPGRVRPALLLAGHICAQCGRAGCSACQPGGSRHPHTVWGWSSHFPEVLECWMVDGPVAHRDPGRVCLGGAALALGTARGPRLSGCGAGWCGQPSMASRRGVRRRSRRHLRLPVTLPDPWASGRLPCAGRPIWAAADVPGPRSTPWWSAGSPSWAGFGILLLTRIGRWAGLMVPAVLMIPLLPLFPGRGTRRCTPMQDQTSDPEATFVEMLGIPGRQGLARHRNGPAPSAPCQAVRSASPPAAAQAAAGRDLVLIADPAGRTGDQRGAGAMGTVQADCWPTGI